MLVTIDYVFHVMTSLVTMKILRYSLVSMKRVTLSKNPILLPIIHQRCHSAKSMQQDTGPHIDDEFIFPVHTSADGEYNFLWSGAAIHQEVCNLNSDEFEPNNKSIVAKSRSVILLQTYHRMLGTVTFVAIKSRAMNQWRFCSISIFGDLLSNISSKDQKITNQFVVGAHGVVENLFRELMSVEDHVISNKKSAENRVADITSQMTRIAGKYFHKSIVLGNFPPDNGHQKISFDYSDVVPDRLYQNQDNASSSMNCISRSQNSDCFYMYSLLLKEVLFLQEKAHHVRDISCLLVSDSAVWMKVSFDSITNDNNATSLSSSNSNRASLLILLFPAVDDEDIPNSPPRLDNWLIGNMFLLD
jgi:hypothetical protein